MDSHCVTKQTDRLSRARATLALLALLLISALVLSACGAGVEQTAQTATYAITLRSEALRMKTRKLTIEVRDRTGTLRDDLRVSVVPVMRSMGMANPEVPATSTGNGRYETNAELFSMEGSWDVSVRIDDAKGSETAEFTLTVAP